MGFVRDHLREDANADNKAAISDQISSEERRLRYERPASGASRRPAAIRTAVLMLVSAACGVLLALLLF